MFLSACGDVAEGLLEQIGEVRAELVYACVAAAAGEVHEGVHQIVLVQEVL